MLKWVVEHSSKISKLAVLVILMLYFSFEICIEKFLFLKPFLVKVLREWNTSGVWD